MRLYSSKADAKKYYESLTKSTDITEDKIKKAFVGKTLYKANKCGDKIKYEMVKSKSDGSGFWKDEENNEEETLKYEIKGNSIITKDDDKVYEVHKVIKIVDGKYVVLKEENGDISTWAYTKEEAAKHASKDCGGSSSSASNNVNNKITKFSKEWLNGRELYYVEYDDFGYDEIGMKWNMATIKFTDKTVSWTEYETPDTGTYTINYSVNSNGELIIDYEHFGKYTIKENKDDYLLVQQNDSDNVYLFFDKKKALEFRDKHNKK